MLTGQIGNRARELVREVCAANYVDIISGSLSPDHVHILVSVPPSLAISKLVQYIKGKSSRKEYARNNFDISTLGMRTK